MTIARHETGSSLTIRDDQDYWTERQVAALRQLGVGDIPPADLAVFFHQCQRTGLDPFARQIYLIGRWSQQGTKYTIQTGIDGFRLVGRRAADRGHETLSMTDPEWCGDDGQWRDVWLSPNPPAAARVAIIRNGGRFAAVALLAEYQQTTRDGHPTKMWAEKPALMLAKCAEALAWRKAFPQDLSGLYTSDEYPPEHATSLRKDEVEGRVPQTVRIDDALQGLGHTQDSPRASSAELADLSAVLAAAGFQVAEMRAWCSGQLGREIASAADLTTDEVRDLIAAARSEAPC